MRSYTEGDEISNYTWCLHCERVFHNDNWSNGECPDCGASYSFDGWDWLRIARLNGYPDIPEEGKEYPQYGFEERDQAEKIMQAQRERAEQRRQAAPKTPRPPKRNKPKRFLKRQ